MARFTDTQIRQLIDALEAAGYTPSDIVLLARHKALGDFRHVLYGRAEIKATSNPSVGSIIRVDRKVRSMYPDWATKSLDPQDGPTEFNVDDVRLWLHPVQIDGNLKGLAIYDYLKEARMLPSCLGLRELEEIQKKGIVFFLSRWIGASVFGWKTVVENEKGELYVPYLRRRHGTVLLEWRWLDHWWNASRPALRFEK